MLCIGNFFVTFFFNPILFVCEQTFGEADPRSQHPGSSKSGGCSRVAGRPQCPRAGGIPQAQCARAAHAIAQGMGGVALSYLMIMDAFDIWRDRTRYNLHQCVRIHVAKAIAKGMYGKAKISILFLCNVDSICYLRACACSNLR